MLGVLRLILHCLYFTSQYFRIEPALSRVALLGCEPKAALEREDTYEISRIEASTDLRIAGEFQLFTQLQSDYAIDEKIRTPVDQDRLDLEQAFIALTKPLSEGVQSAPGPSTNWF